MTSLQLIEIRPKQGLPAIEKIVAASSSYSSLVEHCEKTYGKSIEDRTNPFDVYYTIKPSSFVIV